MLCTLSRHSPRAYIPSAPRPCLGGSKSREEPLHSELAKQIASDRALLSKHLEAAEQQAEAHRRLHNGSDVANTYPEHDRVSTRAAEAIHDQMVAHLAGMAPELIQHLKDAQRDQSFADRLVELDEQGKQLQASQGDLPDKDFAERAERLTRRALDLARTHLETKGVVDSQHMRELEQLHRRFAQQVEEPPPTSRDVATSGLNSTSSNDTQLTFRGEASLFVFTITFVVLSSMAAAAIATAKIAVILAVTFITWAAGAMATAAVTMAAR